MTRREVLSTIVGIITTAPALSVWRLTKKPTRIVTCLPQQEAEYCWIELKDGKKYCFARSTTRASGYPNNYFREVLNQNYADNLLRLGRREDEVQ